MFFVDGTNHGNMVYTITIFEAVFVVTKLAIFLFS